MQSVLHIGACLKLKLGQISIFQEMNFNSNKRVKEGLLMLAVGAAVCRSPAMALNV